MEIQVEEKWCSQRVFHFVFLLMLECFAIDCVLIAGYISQPVL